MTHICDKKEAIEKIGSDLKDHIIKQLESDKERMEYRKQRGEHDALVAEQLSNMNEKLDVVMPTIKEINKMRDGWEVFGTISSIAVKFVIGFGILSTAVYALKEWIRKD